MGTEAEPFVELSVDVNETLELFGYEAIRLSAVHRPWSVNLIGVQQPWLLSHCPHITIHIGFPEMMESPSRVQGWESVCSGGTLMFLGNVKDSKV